LLINIIVIKYNLQAEKMNTNYQSKIIRCLKPPTQLNLGRKVLNSDPSEDDQSDEDFEEGLVKVEVI